MTRGGTAGHINPPNKSHSFPVHLYLKQTIFKIFNKYQAIYTYMNIFTSLYGR